ncbi:quinone-interacting membrane-bound oxidoreductase complex subunit QmoC [Oceanidesulfovibrio marinus]|uniref:Heterodisulfide reductase subunit E n=1 Tax=Oceanidesulfovibrio marinus TaxID=370038 RepID=A0A6P1ZQN0_9BACT|nr:quinone-interacting membrane-bound oxidoreductase complex subunit QmoC [Oceanidesulfovibrio marinus]QJT08795.1 heterodisulfide reductase subunit E [Oceanidesulfovibrio marinus]TVM36777.1 heterodisulfide reductase subunit E [Oceanidesulfovibrio marinus]
MPQPVRIEPDREFINELREAGGDTLKRCYQCATCSVVCPLAPEDNPYPRKEMIWAQWGLKDKILDDIDIWLCHNCGACSDYCPRGANPAELLAAARNITYKKLTKPAILGTWMSSPKHLPKLIAIPALLFLIIWAISTGLSIPEGEIVFGKVFPGDYTIDPVFSLAFFFVLFTFYRGVTKMWKGFKEKTPTTFFVGPYKKPNFFEAARDVALDEIVTHRKWKECGDVTQADEQKFKGHFLVFWAFIALFAVTTIVFLGHWGGKVMHFIAPMGHTPMHLLNPVKLLANAGAIALVVGLWFLTKRRLDKDREKDSSSYYDWYLLGVIWAVAITGILSELLRLADAASLAYPIYYVHLVAVFMLIAYLPWSKLGHLVYRTTALIFTRMTGRVPAPPVQKKTFEI